MPMMSLSVNHIWHADVF